MPLPAYPILVISYSEDTRTALQAALKSSGVESVPCESFCAAENLALVGLYNGMLVDLPSIIKAKGEEKIVAYTLANFFPTLRVRTMGAMLVPMTMPGSAKQDKSLNDFLQVTCQAFVPRTLRAYRRHSVCISALLRYRGEESRSFTLNLSWGGIFLVDMCAERFQIGEEMEIYLPEFDCELRATIRATHTWGLRRAPGVGLSFSGLEGRLEEVFTGLLKTRQEYDRDRLIG